MYDEVVGQNAKTDFRFSMAKFIRGYSWMCNTMASTVCEAAASHRFGKLGARKIQNITNPIDQKWELISLQFTDLACFKVKIVRGEKQY